MIWRIVTLFPCKLPKRNKFFKIGTHFVQDWTATARHGIRRSRGSLYLLYFLSALWLPQGLRLLLRKQSHSPDINHCILGYQVLVQSWLWGVGSLDLIECLVAFDQNPITHLATHPKWQQILSSGLHPDFPKCRNDPNAQNNYRLTLWWPLGLHNALLDAKFTVQNFADQSNQWG